MLLYEHVNFKIMCGCQMIIPIFPINTAWHKNGALGNCVSLCPCEKLCQMLTNFHIFSKFEKSNQRNVMRGRIAPAHELFKRSQPENVSFNKFQHYTIRASLLSERAIFGTRDHWLKRQVRTAEACRRSFTALRRILLRVSKIIVVNRWFLVFS